MNHDTVHQSSCSSLTYATFTLIVHENTKRRVETIRLVMPGMEELSINSAPLEYMPRH